MTNKQQPTPLEVEDTAREVLKNNIRKVYGVKASHYINFEPRLTQLMELVDVYTSTKEREADTVNRFEVINHLSDGSGREVVVWKDEPFEVEYSLQDDGRTLKVFLTNIAHLNVKEKDV